MKSLEKEYLNFLNHLGTLCIPCIHISLVPFKIILIQVDSLRNDDDPFTSETGIKKEG